MMRTTLPDDLAGLVRQKIENLRPKLLDLSRRNPLIATRLGPRSNAHVRAVDELPDVLFYRLNNGEAMRLVPLPAIEDDPHDEQTRDFRDAVINARLTDERYLAEMESVDRDADDYIDRTRQIERALKDRLRGALGLPPRPRPGDVNLVQHARNHGIAPSYDLPRPDSDRRGDDGIQTLLLPADLERKLNAIATKCRTWMQETGINVLHVAYGFLEWSERDQAETVFSPLILCEAKIEKRRTPRGMSFSIAGTGEEPAVNAVLAEKLRLDFGIDMPAFTGSSVEAYFEQVAEISPPNMTWRVRRQVAIGVFPSARMAMYYDLDPAHGDFPDSAVVQSMLGGREVDDAAPYADEYEVDHPDIEAKVPCLVMDADSSQFSALVDMAEGRNLAVEGPPGTGKSQTIVNAIAAALAQGRKVLLVAEKLAALNVVKSRLEALGLGEFLLPLQAERSTREQVIASVRQRIEMPREAAVGAYDEKIKECRRTRQRLAEYIDLMTRPFGNSGLTIREILCKSIATERHLGGVAHEIVEQCQVPESWLTRSGLARLRRLAAAMGRNEASEPGALYHRGCVCTGRARSAHFFRRGRCPRASGRMRAGGSAGRKSHRNRRAAAGGRDLSRGARRGSPHRASRRRQRRDRARLPRTLRSAPAPSGDAGRHRRRAAGCRVHRPDHPRHGGQRPAQPRHDRSRGAR